MTTNKNKDKDVVYDDLLDIFDDRNQNQSRQNRPAIERRHSVDGPAI